MLETAVASLIGMAAAVGITLLLVGTWEVIMVLARRLNERRLADAKKEGKEEGLKTERKRWQTWYASLPDEVKDQQPPPELPQDEEP